MSAHPTITEKEARELRDAIVSTRWRLDALLRMNNCHRDTIVSPRWRLDALLRLNNRAQELAEQVLDAVVDDDPDHNGEVS